MTPVFGQVNYGENMGWAFNSKICNVFNTLGLTSNCPSWGMPTLCQRHAKTMPTHASTMYNTEGFPPVLSIFFACVGIVLAWCWHSVGMPQLGHLLVRPSVSNILHIFELNAPSRLSLTEQKGICHIYKCVVSLWFLFPLWYACLWCLLTPLWFYVFIIRSKGKAVWTEPTSDPTLKEHATSSKQIPHLDNGGKLVEVHLGIDFRRPF